MSDLFSNAEQSRLLYEAVKNQDIQAVKKNFKTFHEYFDTQTLRECVSSGNVEILMLLIDMGAYIPGSNLIELAAAYKHLPMCEMLVLHGEISDKLINYNGGYNIEPEFEEWAKARQRALNEKKEISQVLETNTKPGQLAKI